MKADGKKISAMQERVLTRRASMDIITSVIRTPRYFARLLMSKIGLVEDEDTFTSANRKVLEALGFLPKEVEYAGYRYTCKGTNPILFSMTFRQIWEHNQYGVEDFKNKVVLDVGANAGTFSFYAADKGAKAVHAFEPVSGTMELLKKNIELNKDKTGCPIFPHKLALGDCEGEIEMQVSFPGQAGASAYLKRNYGKTENVQMVTLDNMGLAPDIIKVDAEGAERHILKGARKTILKHKPVVVLSAYHLPDDMEVLPEIICGMGYSCILMKRDEEVFYCTPSKLE
jgi:FkbM family methyltransferase